MRIRRAVLLILLVLAPVACSSGDADVATKADTKDGAKADTKGDTTSFCAAMAATRNDEGSLADRLDSVDPPADVRADWDAAIAALRKREGGAHLTKAEGRIVSHLIDVMDEKCPDRGKLPATPEAAKFCKALEAAADQEFPTTADRLASVVPPEDIKQNYEAAVATLRKLGTGQGLDALEKEWLDQLRDDLEATCPERRSKRTPEATECFQDRGTIEIAAEAFNAQMQRYPENVEELLNDATSPQGSLVKPQLKRGSAYWELVPGEGVAIAKPGIALPKGCE